MNTSGSAHLAVFKGYVTQDHNPNKRGGKLWQTFKERFKGEIKTDLHPSKGKRQFGRDEVMAFAADKRVPTLDVIAAALCWGSIDYRNLDRLGQKELAELESVCHEIRFGDLSPRHWFDKLRAMRLSGRLPGLGPAYYTKLIYFLSNSDRTKRPIAHIMDQWAGCSVNLLTGRDVVLINFDIPRGKNPARFAVSDLNRGENYERFCAEMDHLATTLSACFPNLPVTSELLDAAIMDAGKLGWRKYLMDHRHL